MNRSVGTGTRQRKAPLRGATAALASAPDGRREDEGCVVDVYEVCAVMTFGTAVARAEQPTLPATKSAHSVTCGECADLVADHSQCLPGP